MTQKNKSLTTCKRCTKCNIMKMFKDFYTNGAKGLHCWCKECEKAKRKKYCKANKEKMTLAHRKWCIKNTYGMTLEQYDQMFEDQGGVCKTCGKVNRDGRRLYIDHDHETGKVRGLLCHRCNSLLGYVKDDIDILQNMIAYLKEA